ncbi:hypothetical protein [Nocardioides rubriscoriae]|uniref:hypothetical protein n=1 Tax=Nocardioides rubriscoriae TaxID=642762 RepID=UPI0011DFFFC5|nr:hypothetical protein [Nocardioides rubriscoriae]
MTEALTLHAPRPVVVIRVVQLVWAMVVLAAAITVLAVVLDDEILRSTASVVSADDTRVPPSFTPVVIVLDVVVTSLVLVLLAFFRGGHNWARHCLAATLVLLAVATAAMLRTGPPVAFVPPVVVWLGLDALVVVLLYRPGTTAYVTPVA